MNAADYVIEEAQGPRRPSTAGVTAVSVGYVIVAALVAFFWLVADAVQWPPFDIGFAGPLQLVAGVATVLVGAAFHVRHRDAWCAHRLLALGLALSAAAALLIPVSFSSSGLAGPRQCLEDPARSTWVSRSGSSPLCSVFSRLGSSGSAFALGLPSEG